MSKNKKLFAIILIMTLIMSIFSACGDERKTNTTVSQTAYATIFKQTTSVTPNTTTGTTVESTEQGAVTGSAEVFTTVARTGSRTYYNQNKAMRNISSAQMLQEINAGVTLGDNLDNSGVGFGKSVEEYETYNGNALITNDLIKAYKNAGFKAIRLPISWTEHMNEDNTIDNEWLNRVEEVVKYVLNNGMYCIINSQNDQSWLTTDNSNFSVIRTKFIEMWKSIANRFIDYNDHLLFESFGEILKAENDRTAPSDTDISNTNKLNQAFVVAVRFTGGNNKKRHLIVSTYGSIVDQNVLDGFNLPNDYVKNRIIAKINMYLPSAFCLSGDTKTWGSASDKAYLDGIMTSVYKKFSQLNIPIIIGEYGATDKNNYEARKKYVNYFLKDAYNCYMVCFWCDDGKSFKLLDRTTNKATKNSLISTIINTSK